MSAPPAAAGGDAEKAAFTADFAKKVAALTHADKRSITALTIVADERRERAAEVVAVVLRRLQQLPSGDHRLPLLYLVDSICQNLGKKGADYPKRFQLHLKSVFEQTVKHCSLKVKGSLYRMYNTWRKNHTFNSVVLDEINAILCAHLTEEERAAALARPSAAAPVSSAAVPPPDPRKRAAMTSSPAASPSYGEEPSAKKAMLADPRRAAAAGVPAARPPPLEDELQLRVVLDQVAMRYPQALALVQSTRVRLDQMSGTEAERRAFVDRVSAELQTALTPILAAPAPPPAIAPPAALPPVPVAHLPPQPLPPHPLPPPPHALPYASFAPPPPPPAVASWGAPVPMHPHPLPPQVVPPQPLAARGPPGPMAGPSSVAEPPPRPIRLEEDDLKTRHSWLTTSLTTGIPYACKTCGRRIRTPADMTAHLDWHFKMAKRNALIAKQSGTRSQNWYWSESEWVAADDVIFGVQERGKIAGATAHTSAASAAQAAKEEAAKRAAMSEPADQTQKRCALCNEEFVEKWSDASEGWMYPACLRVTPEMLAEARAAVAALEAAKPATAPSADLGGGQAAAHAAKEEERLLALHRAQQVVQHMQTYQGRLLHSGCHFGLLSNIALSKRPSRGTSPAPGAAASHSVAAAAEHAPSAATAATMAPSPAPATLAPVPPAFSAATPAVKAENIEAQQTATPAKPEPVLAVKAEPVAPAAVVPMDETKDAAPAPASAPAPSSNEDDEEEDDDEPSAFIINT